MRKYYSWLRAPPAALHPRRSAATAGSAASSLRLQRVGGQVLTQSLPSNTKPLAGASGTSSHESSMKNKLCALLLGFSMPWV